MVGPIAILAEPDESLRQLMKRSVAEAGFEVIPTSRVSHLHTVLRMRSLRSSEIVLLVLAARLAAPYASSITEMAHDRLRASLPPARVVWTCEFGTLPAFIPPAVEPCIACLILEKPFDLHALQAVAQGCLNQEPMRSGAQR